MTTTNNYSTCIELVPFEQTDPPMEMWQRIVKDNDLIAWTLATISAYSDAIAELERMSDDVRLTILIQWGMRLPLELTFDDKLAHGEGFTFHVWRVDTIRVLEIVSTKVMTAKEARAKMYDERAAFGASVCHIVQSFLNQVQEAT